MKPETINILRLVTPYVLLVAAVIGYLVKRHYEKLDSSISDINKELKNLPKDYVLKDDYIIAMARLDKGLRDIDSKVTTLLNRGDE